jgi:hypothetical protein
MIAAIRRLALNSGKAYSFPGARGFSRRALALLAAVFLSASLVAAQGTATVQAPTATAQAPTATAKGAAPNCTDIAKGAALPFALPDIGKWMVASDGRIASWLDWKYQDKQLREPINIVLFDAFAKTEDEAYARLEAAAAVNEFEMRTGHSTGYTALIGGIGFGQLPLGKGMAISDGPFELANNHGRIFGPYRWKDGWIFTAAFSRENVDVVTKVKHHFSSFNRARDAFAWALDKEGTYKVKGFVPLGNAIIGDAEIGTGDHDGLAVYLAAVK